VEGTEIKLTDEGEILLRSPGLFREYYKQPELTREVFDDDGYFHTGDKGEWIEKNQAYRITGRVKDMFKSSKGKYVVPVPIEAKLSGNPLIEQTCVMGSGLRAPVAVVVLTPAARSASGTEIEESLASTLDRVNDELESHEKLERMLIVNDEWTIGNGMLTPTLKIRRNLLEDKYRRLIGNNGNQRIQWEQQNSG
jgi:long-subunit acyl-CoA synthetase (AMP-forming)